MNLIINNISGSTKTYLSGSISILNGASYSVPVITQFQASTDSSIRSDIFLNQIQISDGVTTYGTHDALNYLNLIGVLTNDFYGPNAAGSLITENPLYQGGKDPSGNKIGHSLDSVGNTLLSTTIPMINRVDVSTTETVSGNSSTFSSSGMGVLNMSVSVSASSGTNPTLQITFQASDDGVNWSQVHDTKQMTGVDTQRLQGCKLSGRYYRYAWTIGGTSPSFTFAITTTLKNYIVRRSTSQLKYNDIDLTVNGNVSSIFTSNDCANFSIMTIRGADGGNNGTCAIQCSLDGINWDTLLSSFAVNVSTTNSSNFSGQAFRFYRLIVTAHTSAGTRTAHVFWAGNNGS